MKTQISILIIFSLLSLILLSSCERTSYDYGMMPQKEKDKINYDHVVDPQKPVRN